MGAPKSEEQVKLDRFKRFLKVFEEHAKSSKRTEEAVDALVETIGHEKDGLVPAVDDLREEIRGLREDLRKAAMRGGLAGIFSSLARGDG